MSDEFYIGWEPKAPPGTGKMTSKVVLVLLLLALFAGAALVISQRTIGASAFEWGTQKTVAGILQLQPYPHLLVTRPGKAGDLPAFSTYYLVQQWKFGLPQNALAALDGKPVTVKGALIYRANQTMIETRAEWIEPNNKIVVPVTPPPPIVLGKQTFVGEIVDSKCFLGVMNPGQYTPHRACAIRCISGGVPPVLVVKRSDGSLFYLLLVSADGKPVNEQVLNLVAEPVEITGDVERQGDLYIMRADPAKYRKL